MYHITLISGSTMGCAEEVTDHLAKKLEAAGFSTETLHGPNLDELTLNGIWLVITSTRGAGELPDNLQPLSEQFAEQKPNLSQVHFGAIGLGDKDYVSSFCYGIKILNEQLIALKAKRIGEVLEIDVAEHYFPEDPAEKWIDEWIKLPYFVR